VHSRKEDKKNSPRKNDPSWWKILLLDRGPEGAGGKAMRTPTPDNRKGRLWGRRGDPVAKNKMLKVEESPRGGVTKVSEDHKLTQRTGITDGR